MFLTRGFTFTHKTVQAWEESLAPLLTAQLKADRRGKTGRKGHVDETYVKVERDAGAISTVLLTPRGT